MKLVSRSRVIALVFAMAISMGLTSLPISPVAAAEVCQGPAAYPPDLPDCLDPVVVAKQEADAKAAAEASAAASASAKAAAELEEQRKIAELIAKDLAAAAAAAKEAADKAAAEQKAADDAKKAAAAAAGSSSADAQAATSSPHEPYPEANALGLVDTTGAMAAG